MSADQLPLVSRNFYENALFKTALSVSYFALAFFYLGMVCRAGGESRANSIYKDDAFNDSTEDGFNALTVGYGFAAFFYFCSFAIALGAAFHILPATGGSRKEAQAVHNPSILDPAVAAAIA